MLNGLINWLAKVAVGKQIVAGLAWAHDKADGKRSEIILALLALTHALKLVGVIPPEAAVAVEQSLGAILPVTLADRFSKLAKQADSIAG